MPDFRNFRDTVSVPGVLVLARPSAREGPQAKRLKSCEKLNGPATNSYLRTGRL